MSIAYMRAVMCPEDGLLPDLTPTQLLVLLALSDSADEHKDGWCWPALKRITEISRLSERAARDALRDLERLGVLETRAKPGTSNSYRLTFPPNARRFERGPRHEAPPPRDIPAPAAAPPGTGRPPPRHVAPPTPARGAPDPIIESRIDPVTEEFARGRASPDAVKTAPSRKEPKPGSIDEILRAQLAKGTNEDYLCHRYSVTPERLATLRPAAAP